MGIENGRVSLKIIDIEIIRERTSFLLESQPLNERTQEQIAVFFGK